MTIEDLMDEWDGLTKERKEHAVVALFDYLVKDFDKHEDLIFDLVLVAGEAETEDYFGTEGFSL